MPEHIDRYTPGGRGSRSPVRRRGTPREGGRRPGQRREDSGRAPRGGRRDDGGRPTVQDKPRKTADELDAEMDDYFGGSGEPQGNGGGDAVPQNGATDDVDMIT